MTLVAGCYERFIFTFELPKMSRKDQHLQKSFSYPGHQGAVKCIASGGTFIVSGGADDQLHIYDIQSQKDLGFVLNPGEGPISAVALYVPAGAAAPTHLLSGGVDGTLAVWSAGRSWDCLKVMSGHRKEITSLAIHPSGKLALSTSRDSTLRMWDLIKGRCSYHHVLDSIADVVAFSPSGALYALVVGRQVTIHKIGQEAGLSGELPHSRRVMCMAWANDDTLLTGTEAGSIHSWDVPNSKQTCEEVKAHQTRLRGLTVTSQERLSPEAPQDTETKVQAHFVVASAASDGVVKTWRFSSKINQVTLQPLSELATGARLTCLTLVTPLALSEQAIVQHKHAKAKQAKLAVVQRGKAIMKGTLLPHAVGVKKLNQRTNLATDKVSKLVPAQPDLKRIGVVANGVVDFTDAAVKAHPGPTGANSVQLGKKSTQPHAKSSKRRRKG
ncbi:hypothetical protein ABBQ32_009365 [Trebouxia sp. C0010 RCD-2024]